MTVPPAPTMHCYRVDPCAQRHNRWRRVTGRDRSAVVVRAGTAAALPQAAFHGASLPMRRHTVSAPVGFKPLACDRAILLWAPLRKCLVVHPGAVRSSAPHIPGKAVESTEVSQETMVMLIRTDVRIPTPPPVNAGASWLVPATLEVIARHP